MRTTLTLNDEALIIARAVARERKVSLGDAVSHLILRSYIREGEPEIELNGKFPGFRTQTPITFEMVEDILDGE